jgi:DNA modification methylase
VSIGSTCIAAINTGREFIGFETDTNYYIKALDRIEGAKREHQNAISFSNALFSN